jgi:hypothetical protein
MRFPVKAKRSRREIVWCEKSKIDGIITHRLKMNWKKDPMCRFCEAGVCIQDYQSSPKWSCGVVVHGFGWEEYGK